MARAKEENSYINCFWIYLKNSTHWSLLYKTLLKLNWIITFIEEAIIISNKNYAYLGYNVVKEMFMLTLITNNYETPYVYIIEDW